MSDKTKKTIDNYLIRINQIISSVLLPSSKSEPLLNEAMRYSVLNGGKRIRPLLIYTCGECLNIKKEKLDVPALSIELLHSFSLVHDDLPSMDDDSLRRGMPTTHKKFNEATAILAADALQTLAFGTIADSQVITNQEKVGLISIISKACGAEGMTGGQSIDLLSQGKKIGKKELQKLHTMKTGALIHASVMSVFSLANTYNDEEYNIMNEFGWKIGLAFQIRDDLIEIEETSEITGKDNNSDLKNNKATWPAIFGKKASHDYCKELLEDCMNYLEIFNNKAEPLRWLTQYLINRKH